MNMQDDESKKLRREKINMMLNEEERRIITEKAIKYGFGDCLAEYMRASSIYENIYVENIEGKTELLEALSECMGVIREILKEQSEICKKITLSRFDIEKIKSQNVQIIDILDSIKHLIISTLSVSAIYKIQNRLTMIDKYKSDDEFLNKIKTKNNYCVRPSNLFVPRIKNGYLVFIKKYEYVFNPEEVLLNDFEMSLNRVRDIAMQKKMYLYFTNVNGFIHVNICAYFKDYETAKKFADETKENNIINV